MTNQMTKGIHNKSQTWAILMAVALVAAAVLIPTPSAQAGSVAVAISSWGRPASHTRLHATTLPGSWLHVDSWLLGVRP